jgi:PKD repeat protein
LDLRKYKVDKGMTAKLLMLKSILKYPSTKCTPFNWWWYNYGWWPGYGGMPESPLYTCVTETLYMEQASKLITIYGPPNDVKFEGLAYTTCPSQTPIRLFSNYRIDSVSVRNPGVTKVNSDWYYNPYNAFGFDFYNHYSGIKKDSLILYYIHHDFCQDKYDQPIVINPEYKVDTTVALQGFSSYPKVNGFPMVCRSNNITDGVKLSLSSIFYPLITIDRIFVNNDPGNQVIGGHLDSPPPWYFNPAYINYDRGKDTMLNIFYQYFDGIGCPWKKTMQVMVYDTLRPNFTYANICNGDTTTFNNTYTAIGNVSRDSTITWDFGDYTPTTNSNKTKHFYREPGKYPLKMTITSNVGCISRMDSTIIYGDRTNVDFYVKNHVANTGDPNAQITFYNQTVAAKTATSDTIAVAKYTWDFGDNLAGPPIYSPKFIYAYPKAGLYHVKLTAIMENGCTESDTIPIPIFPFVFVTNQTPRLYDFEDGPDGWLASNSFKRGHNSTWAYDTIGYSLADSVRWELDRAWRTSSLDTAPQVAWVESPCFNIDSLRYPMLTMDMFESVEKGLDGVTVQYTDNDGITWSTLGEVNHNVAWYDCEQILSKPAAPKDTATLSDPAFGWSKNMAHWQNVRYPLEDVIEKINADKHPFPCVRFRVKYTTNGSNPPNTTFKGFAFDNFDVTWRKNILLVEQFTNTAFDPTDEKNEFAWLDAFLSAYRDGAVAINYHPWIKNTEDTLFGINRADISARASEYGILFSPKTILDGYYESGTPANQASDTINRYAASVSLRDPGFDIHDVGIQQAGDSLVISAGITKLKAQLTPIKETTTGAHYSQDCVVRMAIVQKEMPLNGIDYKNVLIELLPNGEGNTVATIPESVPVGADMEVTSAWKPAVTTVGNHFRLIVYVQGKAGLSLVQQVWYKDIPDALVPQVTIVPSVKSVNSKSSGSVKVYPSPVSDILYVKFDEKAPARTQWQMVNMAGLVVLNGQLEADTQLFRINVYSLSDGVYLFKTIDADNGAIKTYKVLVQKN